MNGIIVVFPKIEDGKSVRNLLVRYGYEVTGCLAPRGQQVLNYIDTMNDGTPSVGTDSRICIILI